MSHEERVAFGVMKNEGTEGGKINSQGHVSPIDSTPRDCGWIRDRQAASIGKIWNFKTQKGRFLRGSASQVQQTGLLIGKLYLGQQLD